MDNLKVKGRIHSIETFGAVDGPGIRFIVFFQGCMLRCLYCHNPDSWNKNDGQETSVEELVNKIISYKNYLSGGLTISGGEPLMQREFAIALLSECKKHNIHTALDTSAGIDISLAKSVIDVADMLLLDIKAATPSRYEQITASPKAYKNAFDALDYCEQTKKPVWIRHVLLPQYTLNYEELEIMAKELAEYSCIERVELLPFHKMGEHKWEELKYEYKLFDIEAPLKTQTDKVIEIFKKHGLNAR